MKRLILVGCIFILAILAAQPSILAESKEVTGYWLNSKSPLLPGDEIFKKTVRSKVANGLEDHLETTVVYKDFDSETVAYTDYKGRSVYKGLLLIEKVKWFKNSSGQYREGQVVEKERKFDITSTSLPRKFNYSHGSGPSLTLEVINDSKHLTVKETKGSFNEAFKKLIK